MSVHAVHHTLHRGRELARDLLYWRFERGLTTAQVARRTELASGHVRELMVAEMERQGAQLDGRLRELRGESSPAAHQLTTLRIVQVVAQERGFSVAEITPPGRMKKMGAADKKFGRRSLARQIALFLSHTLLKLSYQKIAVDFCIDPGSVGLSVRGIKFQYEHDKVFRAEIDRLAEKCLAGV
jgi:chromosomal replication initiation ATPase DnaA